MVKGGVGFLALIDSLSLSEFLSLKNTTHTHTRWKGTEKERSHTERFLRRVNRASFLFFPLFSCLTEKRKSRHDPVYARAIPRAWIVPSLELPARPES